MDLMQSSGFGDVRDDNDFDSCVDFEQHIASIHIDVTSQLIPCPSGSRS